jgi:hypothetical protein
MADGVTGGGKAREGSRHRARPEGGGGCGGGAGARLGTRKRLCACSIQSYRVLMSTPHDSNWQHLATPSRILLHSRIFRDQDGRDSECASNYRATASYKRTRAEVQSRSAGRRSSPHLWTESTPPWQQTWRTAAAPPRSKCRSVRPTGGSGRSGCSPSSASCPTSSPWSWAPCFPPSALWCCAFSSRMLKARRTK